MEDINITKASVDYALTLPKELEPTIIVYARKAFEAGANWMKEQHKPIKKEPMPDVDIGKGKCVRCKNAFARVDYNGHGHWVCESCDNALEREFEDEYR